MNLGKLVSKLRSLLNQRAQDSEFDSEIQGHIELLAEHYRAQGFPAREAMYRARRQFGNTSTLKESRREQQSFPLLESISRQLRLAFRQLRANPFFTALAVLSLALGIGANTAVFTVLDQLILRLLPVKDPQGLVMLWSQGPSLGSNNGDRDLSYPMYEKVQRRAEAFTSVFCRFFTSADLSNGNHSERVLTELVSGNYFEVLGAAPALGRVFSPSVDDRTYMGAPAVVLTHAYWVSRFAGDPSVIGRKILINRYPMQIVGVAAPEFAGVDPYRPPQIFVPVQMMPVLVPGQNALGDRWARWFQVFARLKPGYTAASARASLQILYSAILADDAHDPVVRDVPAYQMRQSLRQTVVVEPAGTGYSELRRKYATALMVLMGMAGLMLVIACSNVANLLIAKAAARQKEMAVHLAIGASRGTLIRRLLTESLLLALAGAIAGVLIAYGASSALLAIIPARERAGLHAEPDGRIILFTLVVSVMTAVVFGLTPALQGTRLDVWTTLKDSAGAIAGAAGSLRLRKALVIAQVSLSFLLLAGAAVFARSLLNLQEIDTGFRDISRIYTFQIDGPRAGYSIGAARSFYDLALARVRGMHGVQAASFAMVPVLNSTWWGSNFSVEGYIAKEGEDRHVYYNAVAPGYWRTMGVPLLAGRDFNEADRARSNREDEQPRVAIVNRKFATHYFGGAQNAIGKHVGFAGMHNNKPSAEIVGVTEDSLYDGPRTGIKSEIFFAFRQANWPLSAVFYVRVNETGPNVIPELRSVVSRVDPIVPLFETSTLDAQLSATLATERLIATLSIVFGALAAILAALGLYGVMAYVVARRTKEIGVRMALGAKQHLVVWSVLRESLLLISAGLACGVPLAYALSHYASSELFGVHGTDPALYLVVAALLGFVGVVSTLLPARRAAAISPLVAIRYE